MDFEKIAEEFLGILQESKKMTLRRFAENRLEAGAAGYVGIVDPQLEKEATRLADGLVWDGIPRQALEKLAADAMAIGEDGHVFPSSWVEEQIEKIMNEAAPPPAADDDDWREVIVER